MRCGGRPPLLECLYIASHFGMNSYGARAVSGWRLPRRGDWLRRVGTRGAVGAPGAMWPERAAENGPAAPVPCVAEFVEVFQCVVPDPLHARASLCWLADQVGVRVCSFVNLRSGESSCLSTPSETPDSLHVMRVRDPLRCASVNYVFAYVNVEWFGGLLQGCGIRCTNPLASQRGPWPGCAAG